MPNPPARKNRSQRSRLTSSDHRGGRRSWSAVESPRLRRRKGGGCALELAVGGGGWCACGRWKSYERSYKALKAAWVEEHLKEHLRTSHRGDGSTEPPSKAPALAHDVRAKHGLSISQIPGKVHVGRCSCGQWSRKQPDPRRLEMLHALHLNRIQRARRTRS
jgi:hypothetical protein